MKRETAKHALIIVGLVVLGALSIRAGLIAPPTLRNLAWILLAYAVALASGAIGGWIGGVLGAGRAMGRRLGLAPGDCGKRGARYGLLFGALITGLAWHDPGLPGVVGALGGGFAAGLFVGLLGMFISRAEALFLSALEDKGLDNRLGALTKLREYLRVADQDPGRARRVREAQQLIRELEGQPAQDGWGSEPEAAGAPQGRGTEPEGTAPPLGRGAEPEGNGAAEVCSAEGPGAGVPRSETPGRQV